MIQPKKYTKIGEYKHYLVCRFCFSNKITPVIDLGNMPLAGGFLKNIQQIDNEKLYPLEISFCNNCYLLQSVNVVDAGTLFNDYFYHSSAIKTLTNHFQEVAQEIINDNVSKNDLFVVEIGSNDGSLVNNLLDKKIKALGVDPAKNIVRPLLKKNLPFICDYFTKELAENIIKKYGQADVIFSSNTLAHIEDMHSVINGTKLLLKPDGYLMFEVQYLGNLLNQTQYDFIYHEHQYYYSLLTLTKFFSVFDMEIYEVKKVPIHGGSIRYYVKHKSDKTHKMSDNVNNLSNREIELKFDKLPTYVGFEKMVNKTKSDLLKLLDSLKKQKKTIAGYGASGRGTIIMNYCGLDSRYIDYVIDDAPAKIGSYTPGTHLKIRSSEVLSTNKKPDYILLLAWSFYDEILKKQKKYISNGGKFILPLPKVLIVK